MVHEYRIEIPGPKPTPSHSFITSPQGTRLSKTLHMGLLLPPQGPYLGVGLIGGTESPVLLPADWLNPGALFISECKKTHRELATYITDRKRHSRDTHVWNSKTLRGLISNRGWFFPGWGPFLCLWIERVFLSSCPVQFKALLAINHVF